MTIIKLSEFLTTESDQRLEDAFDAGSISNFIKKLVNFSGSLDEISSFAPIYILEPESSLKIFSRKNISNFNKMKTCKTRLEKILQVVIFQLSSFPFFSHKLKSPINPILSETFSCHYDNIKFHSELLSTNPTVSGIYISNEDHSVNFQHINDSKFGLGKGGFNFIIKDYGLCKMTVLGDVFRIELPSISVQPTSSFIFNSTTELYPVGEMVIKCEEVEASIKFQPKSFMKSYSTKISGEIKSKGEVKYIIEGDWKNEMYIENYHTKKKNLVALGNICPISNPDYPLRTIIDESTGSDKVWEKVISLMQIKNYKEAQKLKSRLEHWQKCYVEDLKKQGQEHEAKYFEKINGNWEFKNNEI